MSRREEILSKVSEIVVIPSCVQKAAVLMNDENADMEELARLIEHDPGLTVNLLKIVNSSLPDTSRLMVTAHEAFTRLGTAQVFQFILSTGVAPSFVHKVAGYDLTPTMHLQHSLATGMAAQALGKELKLDVPDSVFTAGLLAGVGKIIMGAYLEINVNPIFELAEEEGLSFDQAEDRVLGINHAELGGIMLENWELPKELVDVVKYHLRPDEFEGENRALDLVHMGSALAKMIGVGLGVDGLNYVPSQKVAERLKLTTEIVDAVAVIVVEGLNEVQDIFLPNLEGLD